jgi:engulfment/cell motility protein 1
MKEQQGKTPETQFPFARASIEMTEILADYWSISTGYTTTTKLQPLSLNFERIHSASLLFFYRLWVSLSSTTSDFTKLLGLTRCQMRYALRNECNMTIYEYMSEMDSVSVATVTERYEKLLEEEDDLLSKLPVR